MDKKRLREKVATKKLKREVTPYFFCSEQRIIRPKGQTAYQRDKDLQEQIKNSIDLFQNLQLKIVDTRDKGKSKAKPHKGNRKTEKEMIK